MLRDKFENAGVHLHKFVSEFAVWLWAILLFAALLIPFWFLFRELDLSRNHALAVITALYSADWFMGWRRRRKQG